MSINASKMPSQCERHIWHIGLFGMIGIGGLIAKPRFERSLEISEDRERKIAAYFCTCLSGAIIGGTGKLIRTGSPDGTLAGITAGAIVALVGAVLSEIRWNSPCRYIRQAICKILPKPEN